ncbi:alpha-tocopherol transfer protein-like [Lycorma delicatula]|uniref:alpha-tocopherol transfer protein-like n=1 Tax=Lycorma delicatula TaxID=130591 RepID=UPI003F5175F7
MSDNKLSSFWKVSIEDETKKNPNLTVDKIKEIRDWITTQEHLPNITDHNIVMFIHSCKYDLERAKLTIDLHFTYRTLMKDIFTKRDPEGDDVNLIRQCCKTTVLPGKDSEGNFVLWGHMYNSDLKKFKFASAGKLYIMTADVLQLEQGTVPGVVTVYDVKNMSLSHLLSTPVSIIRHYVIYCQDASPFPVKAIHFVNTHPVMDKLMTLVKPFIKSSVWKIQYFHSNMDSLYKHIPKDIIPQEYGGNGGSLEEICENNFEKLRKYREFFLEEEKMRVDESKRADKTRATALADIFKKLNVD